MIELNIFEVNINFCLMNSKVRKTKMKMTKTLRRMWLFIVVLVLLAVLLGGRFYRYIYGNNVDLTKVESPYLYVPNGNFFFWFKKDY